LWGGTENDTLYGGDGIDDLFAEAGDDIVRGDAGNDYVSAGTGNDLIYGDTDATTGTGNDYLRGDAGADTIFGGNGDDNIIGGAGLDALYGNAGADWFSFVLGDSDPITPDVIFDFSQPTYDRISFSSIDADPLTAGDQAFTYIASAGFSASGRAELRWYNSGLNTYVEIDMGDGSPDLAVKLTGFYSLKPEDFML
jgi:Ca2+-binding RTX toxin-like protein